MYNVNVFFGLLRSHTFRLDGLRRAVIERFVSRGALRAIRNIQFLHAERVLVPMREIDNDGNTIFVSLLEQNLEAKDENADVRELIERVNVTGQSRQADMLNQTFSLQSLQPLRLSVVSDEKDRSGYITHTVILPVGRTKRAVDTAYNLPPNSMLRILYLPIYRLTFNDSGKKMVCFANENLSGLPINGGTGENKGFDFEDMFPFAFAISAVLTIILDVAAIATGNISVSGSSFLGKAIFFVLAVLLVTVILMLLFMSATTVILFICSRLSVSLNVIKSFKQWLIRRKLTKRFRLNEKCK